MELGIVEEPGNVERVKTGQKEKQAQIGAKTRDLHFCCSCWVSGKLFHPRSADIYRCLKHLAYKERYNEVINSMKTS